MTTQAASEATKTLKGKFNCFPFKFLFQGQNGEQQVKDAAIKVSLERRRVALGLGQTHVRD